MDHPLPCFDHLGHPVLHPGLIFARIVLLHRLLGFAGFFDHPLPVLVVAVFVVQPLAWLVLLPP